MKQNRFFPEIRGNFGFGCMRLPMTGDQVDIPQTCRMADAFIEAGFNYFDTAHGYINGQSEKAIGQCVSARHDRSEFLLADKLSDSYFQSEADIRPFVDEQLKICGVEYFDFYLMHAQNRRNYEKYKACNAYEVAYQLKQEGKLRHVGLSFHDKADVLDMILTEKPFVEFVQIQLNYVDFDDPAVEAHKVYDVCVKHGKPCVIMEPVKGGSLVNLPPEADKVLRETGSCSNAGYAIRFAASFDNVFMVLSGMSSIEQMQDNIGTMKEFAPLTDEEQNAVARVCGIFKNLGLIPCTSCRYCVEQNHCPKNILIPDMFAALNKFEAFHDWITRVHYGRVLTADGHSKASECLKCGLCEKVCPQHLEIRKLLKKVAETFEQN